MSFYLYADMYDMTFAIYDAALSGNLIAGPITNTAVAVSNGLFTVTLNFGAGVFTGTNYWVQMAVSTNGANNFSTLVPNQPLTPAPYAISLVSPQATALCPPGSVMAYMGVNAPNGWLLCDGSNYPTNQYPELFAVIGSSSGASGGATTFNVPDCRGIFLRGVNGSRSDAYADPGDARVNLYAGGNSGNAVGSYQADMFAQHSHDNGSYSCGNNSQLSSYERYGEANAGTVLSPIASWAAVTEYTGNTSAAGGSETRSKNIYVNYIIKY